MDAMRARGRRFGCRRGGWAFALVLSLGCGTSGGGGAQPTGPDAGAGADGDSDVVASECELPSVPAGAIDVRDFGAKGDGETDDTAAIQKAVEAAPKNGTVWVPDGVYMIDAATPEGDWWRGVALKSDLTFLMSSGATLRTIPNGSHISAVLVVENASNVTIAGGTLEGDRDGHLGTEGESGMGIAIVSSTGVTVRRTIARRFWGDGFYVAMYPDVWTRDVRICGVLSDGNRRQGLSVVGADGVVVEDSTFSSSQGTAPEYGIDLEPNPDRVVKNVRIERCRLLDNRGAGIGMAERSSANTVRGSTFRGNGNGITVIRSHQNFILDNVIDQNQGEGIWLLEANENAVSGNSVSANGLEHSGWHDNIRLDSSSANTLTKNVCRAGVQEIKPSWGISLHDDSRGNVVKDNDLREGGALGGLSDEGIETQVSGNLL